MATPDLPSDEMRKAITKSASAILVEELKRAFPHPDCIVLIDGFSREELMKLVFITRQQNNLTTPVKQVIDAGPDALANFVAGGNKTGTLTQTATPTRTAAPVALAAQQTATVATPGGIVQPTTRPVTQQTTPGGGATDQISMLASMLQLMHNSQLEYQKLAAERESKRLAAEAETAMQLKLELAKQQLKQLCS